MNGDFEFDNKWYERRVNAFVDTLVNSPMGGDLGIDSDHDDPMGADGQKGGD